MVSFRLVKNLLGVILVPLLLAIAKRSKMLRRFSSTFRKGKKEDSQTNGINNVNGVNASSSSAKPDPQRRRSNLAPQKEDKEPEDHSAGHTQVESTFQQYAQLIHAARRPLPTQSGDGAYLDHDMPSGLMDDLKHLGFKDINTLMGVMKTKASGELADDKTYLMERVIQVSPISCKLVSAC